MKILKFAFVLLTAAFVFGALACGSPAGNSASTDVNIEAGSNSTDDAQPMAGSGEVEATAPETIVAELYKTHDAKKSPFFQTKDRALVDKFFVKATADLIWRDAKESAEKNTVGLGFDPLYDGQDFEIKDFKITPGTTKDAVSSATAEFTNFGEKQTVTFLLREDSGTWKVENIRYKHGTLLAILRDQFNVPKEEVISEPASFAGKYRVGTTTCTVRPVGTAFRVSWEKGNGFETFEYAEGTTFDAPTEDGGVNRFAFDDDRYDTGTFYRADGKTLVVRRAK